ncbi:radical SAM protein [Thiospirochaeta perfilievii]|uniref:Radical SAM protein n=1 Tax=Thiospirochaeta perfilievii TaxID=252967 RepID=A0A5C1QE99_9SPIO|nr:radical SAM protein [Thiospirochaeta perfilievii]QEN04976.1 radical SAM protein [Thiospirochaeta perfilievii]
MIRYSRITNKIKREIVLLKGKPCKWGKCSFCDYIEDNSTDEDLNDKINFDILSNITGEYGVLEVINSGNVFELSQKTLNYIKEIIVDKKIDTLFFEAHWIYRKRVKYMRDFFGVKCIVKTGLESFNQDFRERILLKGFDYKNIDEIKEYFDSVCLMVGIQGQSKEMIINDIELARNNFNHFTINIFVENSTNIKPDNKLISWFQSEYKWLDSEQKCDVLWVNTDFGVGD